MDGKSPKNASQATVKEPQANFPYRTQIPGLYLKRKDLSGTGQLRWNLKRIGWVSSTAKSWKEVTDNFSSGRMTSGFITGEAGSGSRLEGSRVITVPGGLVCKEEIDDIDGITLTYFGDPDPVSPVLSVSIEREEFYYKGAKALNKEIAGGLLERNEGNSDLGNRRRSTRTVRKNYYVSISGKTDESELEEEDEEIENPTQDDDSEDDAATETDDQLFLYIKRPHKAKVCRLLIGSSKDQIKEMRKVKKKERRRYTPKFSSKSRINVTEVATDKGTGYNLHFVNCGMSKKAFSDDALRQDVHTEVLLQSQAASEGKSGGKTGAKTGGKSGGKTGGKGSTVLWTPAQIRHNEKVWDECRSRLQSFVDKHGEGHFRDDTDLEIEAESHPGTKV